VESLKQLVDIYKEIDVRMHAIYANVIHIGRSGYG